MKKELDPISISYIKTLTSPMAELMVRDLIEEYVLQKVPPGVDLVAFNGKRELVIDILRLAQIPVTDLVVKTTQEE